MKTKLITLILIIIIFLHPILCLGQATDRVNSTNVKPAMTGELKSAMSPEMMMPPMMGLTSTYAMFSANGAISNVGISHVIGDVGTNLGLISGFTTLNVTGMIHPIPDLATSLCIADLLTMYNFLNLSTINVELLNSSMFGHNLILLPMTYHLSAATMLTDTLFINAQGDPNAIFCIKINGALTTTVNSRVILMNGAQAKNIYWKIEGAVTISDNSIFRGIIVSNNGAILLKAGVMLDGVALTTTGSISINSSTVIKPSPAVSTNIESVDFQNPVNEITIAPNPFSSYANIQLKNDSKYMNCNFKIYNMMGVEVLNSIVLKQVITLNTSRLHAGVYFYKVLDNQKLIQSGKLISIQ
jgi:hypothetical protein